MAKTIHIKLEDNEYYQLVELKGKLKTDTWEDLVKKVIKELK